MQTSTITKRPWKTTLLTGLLTLLCAGAALAQQMNYQGRLTGANGNAVPDAQYAITFDIYDSATADTRQWGPQVIPADTVQGRFNVILGPTDATNRNIVDAFNGGTKFLQITFQGNPILPRQQILSSPTAFFAQQAGQLASVFVLNGNVGIGKTNPATALDVVGSATFSSKVAIGTTNPGALLDIRNNTNNTGPNEHLRLSGSAYDVSGGTSTQGISFFLGLNRDDLVRTDLMIGNSRKLAATDSVVRIIPGVGDVSYIDSVTRTGGSFKDLALQGTTMMIKSNGNVGIGTTTPAAKLDVNGNIHVGAYSAAAGNPKLIVFGDGDDAAGFVHVGESGVDDTLELKGTRISMVGNVGIGTAWPAVKLDVVGSTSITMVDNGYNNNAFSLAGTTYTATGTFSVNGGGIELYGMWGGGNFPADFNYVAPVGIRADGWIATARGFVAYSDRRIKRDTQASATAKDLTTIQQLQVTDYRMVDPADGGSAWRKGFIAQEVEQVIPGAVSRSVEFVPDVFSLSTAAVFDSAAKTLAVTLAKNHSLKAGDRVRLHLDGKRVDLNVSAVPSAREFVVEQCESAPEKVLVYGKQVSDFRTLDYDRIFTTSVGAIQELARRLEKVEAQASHLADLEQKAGRVATLEQEVADLKKMVAQLAKAGKDTEQAAQATTTPRPAAAAPVRKTVTTASLGR